jgi:hypothetical protein
MHYFLLYCVLIVILPVVLGSYWVEVLMEDFYVVLCNYVGDGVSGLEKSVVLEF